ncbi:MAG: arylmalonate decarboxylase [Sulfolobus sp.]
MKRIGLIVVENNGGSETDFRALVPKDVGIFATRMKKRPSISTYLHEPADLDLFKKELTEEAEKLKDLVNVIVYQRTYGTHKNSKIIYDVLSKFGKPFVIAELSAIKLFNEMKINKIWIFTPYVFERTIEEVKFFEENGFEVTGYTYLNLASDLEYSNVTWEEIYNAIIKNNIKADALYIHCTDLTTYEVIPKLKEKLKIPILSENSASLILALRAINENIDSIIL